MSARAGAPLLLRSFCPPRAPASRAWHVTAVAIHLLLGGANLLFWDAFVTFGMVPAGVVATALHGAFLALEAWCAASRGSA